MGGDKKKERACKAIFYDMARTLNGVQRNRNEEFILVPTVGGAERRSCPSLSPSDHVITFHLIMCSMPRCYADAY